MTAAIYVSQKAQITWCYLALSQSTSSMSDCPSPQLSVPLLYTCATDALTTGSDPPPPVVGWHILPKTYSTNACYVYVKLRHMTCHRGVGGGGGGGVGFELSIFLLLVKNVACYSNCTNLRMTSRTVALRVKMWRVIQTAHICVKRCVTLCCMAFDVRTS